MVSFFKLCSIAAEPFYNGTLKPIETIGWDGTISNNQNRDCNCSAAIA